jgi:hypothetical protein
MQNRPIVDPDEFVVLSELGLNQDQIQAHFRATSAEMETMAQENWQCSAAEACARLRAAGPTSLLAKAAEMAGRGNEKMLLYLLEKLWRPQVAAQSAPATQGQADPKTLSDDQLTRIYRIMSEGGV